MTSQYKLNYRKRRIELSKKHPFLIGLVLSMNLYVTAGSAGQGCSIEEYPGAAFTTPKVEKRLLDPNKIVTELENWITQIKETHPKLDMATDYEQLLSVKSIIVGEVKKPISQLEVFRLFSLLNPVFGDGHHGIVLPAWSRQITDAIEKGDRLFPLEVYIDDDYHLFVKAQYGNYLQALRLLQ